MISVRDVWRWSTVSNERAVANARAAATECSRRRVERAEVEQFLAAYDETPVVIAAARKAAATGG